MSAAPEKKSLCNLPSFLTTGWNLDAAKGREAEAEFIRENWTLSSLAEDFLEAQINHCLASGTDASVSASLVHLSTGKIIQMLEESENIDVDIRTIVKNLDDVNLRHLLRDSRLSYVLLRLFLRIIPTVAGRETVLDTLNVDVDEAILRSEQYLRSRSSNLACIDHHVGLVTIEELSTILGKQSTDLKGTISLQRKDPLLGGFEFLDERRERNIEILANSKAFNTTFHRITKGILIGLDWNNVLVAGGIALTTLMHTDSDKDNNKSVKDPDIDIYLYGLNTEQANEKVEHIYNVWRHNLPSNNRQMLVVKNAKTITFLADYPNRRVQIILKLLSSPIRVLLNFDLDACAIGFDGTQAMMLPRCARAIETGYSIFTMDLVWGHYLGNRRATRESRVFKYADRGFGLRILPCYVQSLESFPIDEDTAIDEDGGSSEDANGKDGYEAPPRAKYQTLERFRRPEGAEPGLKTLRRIVYIGQDFTNRFCFGSTPLAWKPQVDFDGDWDTDYATRKKTWEISREKVNQARRTFHPQDDCPLIRLSTMHADSRHSGNSNDQGCLNQFEFFMRHCEAWRLDARYEAKLDRDDAAPEAYHDNIYDVMPQYEWDGGYNKDELIDEIDAENNNMFENLKATISSKLGIEYQHVGYRNYLTRRIRLQVYGPDLKSVMDKQITIPVLIPYYLETHLKDLISAFPDISTRNRLRLIPVHDPAKHDPTTATIPSLHDIPSEAGNLRYWVISNKSMWACQHRVIDEVFEVMKSLFNWFKHTGSQDRNYATDHKEAILCLARAFRRRIILPDAPGAIPSTTGLSKAEAMLFRVWAFATPPSVNQARDSGKPEFDEHAYMYPVPDELFWKDDGRERMHV